MNSCNAMKPEPLGDAEGVSVYSCSIITESSNNRSSRLVWVCNTDASRLACVTNAYNYRFGGLNTMGSLCGVELARPL